MTKSPQYIQQAENQSSASLKLRKYVFTKISKVAVTASVAITEKNSGFHARRNPRTNI